MAPTLFMLVWLVCLCQDFASCRIVKGGTRVMPQESLCTEIRGKILIDVIKSIKNDRIKRSSLAELWHLYHQRCEEFNHFDSKEKNPNNYALFNGKRKLKPGDFLFYDNQHNTDIQLPEKRQIRGGKKRSNGMLRERGFLGDELQAKRQVRGGKRSSTNRYDENEAEAKRQIRGGKRSSTNRYNENKAEAKRQVRGGKRSITYRFNENEADESVGAPSDRREDTLRREWSENTLEGEDHTAS